MKNLSPESLIEFSLSQKTLFEKLKCLVLATIFYRKLKQDLTPSKQKKSAGLSEFSDDVYPLF